MRTATPGTLRDLLQARGLTLEATAVLAGSDASTISRILNGHVRPRPATATTPPPACCSSPAGSRSPPSPPSPARRTWPRR
jgi:hypothetical protein